MSTKIPDGVSVADDGAWILATPAAHFRLTYSTQVTGTSSGVSHVDSMRRSGDVPDALDRITDVVADPCWPDGARYAGNDRPGVTVNGVTYTGTLYYVATGYHIGWSGFGDERHLYGDNGWCVDRGHYWHGANLNRWDDNRARYADITPAGLRKLAGWLDPAVSAMLADAGRVRDYWSGSLVRTADYAVRDARRDITTANETLALARRFGATTADVPMPAPLCGDDR